MSGSLLAAAVSSSVTAETVRIILRADALRLIAYRLCFASQSSAESPEPSVPAFVPHSRTPGRLLLRRKLPQGSVALPAPACYASTTELTLRRRPDAPVQMSWRQYLYSWLSACSRGTFLPRPNVRASLACRGLRPCPLYYLCQAVVTAIAVTPSCPKQQRPT